MFQNAAAHLKPGGCFVIEVIVPDLRRLPPGERVRAFDLRPSYLGFDEYTDFAGQTLYSHHYWTTGSTTVRCGPSPRPIATSGRPSSI